MESDLLALLREEYGEHPEGPRAHKFQFAASNRERAAWVVAQIEGKTGFTFPGRQVVDVGSAYAGFVIVAAQRGARAWGIEVSPRFYRYGELNAKGESGEIHLIHGDFLSQEVIASLPRGFDLALCNCLFEHVRDTAGLLDNLYAVLAEGGLVIFRIPNGEAVQMVEKEGHSYEPGLTLLPPEMWQEANGIYYRPWSYYEGMFKAFGFRSVLKWNSASKLALARMTQEVGGVLDRVEGLIRGTVADQTTREAMLAGLVNLRGRVARDAEQENPEVFTGTTWSLTGRAVR